MQIPPGDVDILRGLGEQVAEIASLPIQQERRELKARIDRLEQAKPPVHIYQEPWNELNVEGELDLHCQENFCRGIEQNLRRTLYKWRHYQGDMIVGEAMVQPLCIVDTGFGIREDVDIRKTSESSDVVSRHFHIQIKEESDAEKIQFPRVHHDVAKTEEQFEARSQIFEGIMPVVKQGVGSFWFNPWDDLVRWTGVQEVLMDMALRPDYVHKIVDRLVSAWICRLDQYEEQGLLTVPCKEMWGVGAAQIFSEVSPAMHREFALQHEARWYSRFGWTYYGCCEPLHNKVDIIREAFPNLKKISMSPWVDFSVAVPKVGSDLIFAWKPNPAWLASETWQPEEVRRYLHEHLEQALGGGCVMEIHLKDISTVRWEPQRLWEWARLADEVTAEFA
ncbi:hypothetical protein LLH03_14130 [bacterium]|nr:hypothetical protein [bacterium]